MNRRLRDESGVAAVLVVLMLFVFIAMMALAIDGGLLWTKFRRVRSANDAAALAAAISCAKGKGQTGLEGADPQADWYATRNVGDAFSPNNDYPMGCEPAGGEVTVHYRGEQSLMFAPAIHIESPKTVSASATAVWGAAGGANGIVPIMLSSGALGACGIPNGNPPEDCVFWWHKDLVSQATWSIMDLNTWPDERGGDCDPKYQPPIGLHDGIEGFPYPLFLEENPTYVCTLSGAHADVKNQVTAILDAALEAGEPLPLFMFPVNQAGAQVDANGDPCAFGSTCDVYQYAIIGFAEMQVTYFAKGGPAVDACVNDPKFPTEDIPTIEGLSPGSFYCLKATWLDWNTSSYIPGGGASFGVAAVGLTK